MSDKLIQRSFPKPSLIALLMVSGALVPTFVAAQDRTDCVYDQAGSSNVPNADVPIDNYPLTRRGEWTADTVANRFEVYSNSLSSKVFGGGPVEMRVAEPKTFVHFDRDVGLAGNGATAVGDPSGFCNLKVVPLGAVPAGTRRDVVFDTLDGDRIFDESLALGSQGVNTPQLNPDRHLRLNQLTLENIDLTIDGLRMIFFDPRQGGQGSEATLTLDNASLDAGGTPVFGTSATAGAPVPLRITSKGGAGVTNALSFGGLGGQFTSAGTTQVDITEGTILALRNTGGTGNDSDDVYLFPKSVGVGGGSTISTAWTFDVGPDGNGGTLHFDDARVHFEEGTVNLHDNARFEVDFSTSNQSSEIADLVFVGDGATHAASPNAVSRIGTITIQGNNATIDHAGGVVEAQAFEVDRGASGTVVTGSLPSNASVDWALFLNDEAVTFRDIDSAISAFEVTPFTFEATTSLVFDNANLTLQPQDFQGVLDLTLRSGAGIYIPVQRVFGDRFDVSVEAGNGTPSLLRLGGLQDLGANYDFNVIADAPFGLELQDNGRFAVAGDLSIAGTNTDVITGLAVQLFPGDACGAHCTTAAPTPAFGTFGTEGRLRFGPLSEVTLDIGRDGGGILDNDSLRYGDNPQGASDIASATFRLRPLGFSDASDIDGETFVLVERSPGTNGGINSLGGDPLENQLNVDPTMPAALDFFIIEEPQDTGRLVIGAQSNQSAILKHTTGRNHNNMVQGLVTQVATPNPPQTSNNTSLQTAVNTLTVSQVQQMQNAHAEPYSSYLTVGLEQMDMVFDMVSRQTSGGPGSRELSPVVATRNFAAPLPLSTQGSTSRIGTPSQSWVDFAYARGDVEGQDNLGSYGYTLTGLAGGVNLIDEPTHTAGVFLGFGTSALDEHEYIEHDISGRSFHLGAYGQYALPSDWMLDGVIGYMYAQNESERVAPDIGAFLGGKATADFDSHGLYSGISASKDFSVATYTVLTPSFGLAYSHLRQQGFDESGARDFNWNVDDAEADALVASIGLDASRRFQTSEGGTWSLDAMIRYHHDFFAAKDNEHEITVNSPLFGSVTQVGQNRGPNGLSIGLGASGHLNENTSFGVGYAHTWNSNGDEYAVAANIVFTR